MRHMRIAAVVLSLSTALFDVYPLHAQSCSGASVSTNVNLVSSQSYSSETFDLSYVINGAFTDYGDVTAFGEPVWAFSDCTNTGKTSTPVLPSVTFSVSSISDTNVVFSIIRSSYQMNATMCFCSDANPNGYKSLSPGPATPALTGTFTAGC